MAPAPLVNAEEMDDTAADGKGLDEVPELYKEAQNLDEKDRWREKALRRHSELSKSLSCWTDPVQKQ